MKPSRNEFLISNQAAGGYTLPAAVSLAHTAYARLRGHVIPKPDHHDPLVATFNALVAAAVSGAELPTRAEVTTWKADEEASATAQTALSRAQEHAQGTFDSLVEDLSEEIVTDHLAPAHTAVINQVRSMPAQQFVELRTPVQAATANAKVRTALVEFTHLVDQYAVLRDVWWRLIRFDRDLTYPTLATFYSEIKNPGEAWPDFSRLNHQVRAAVTPPWQAEVRERLLWLALHPEAQTWLPTAAQLNAHIYNQHAEEIEEQRRSRHAASAVRAWGGE